MFELPLPEAFNGNSYKLSFTNLALVNSKLPNKLQYLGKDLINKLYLKAKLQGNKKVLPLYKSDLNLNQTVFPIFLDFDNAPNNDFNKFEIELNKILPKGTFNIARSASGRIKVWFFIKTDSYDLNLGSILKYNTTKTLQICVIKYLSKLLGNNNYILDYLDPCPNGMIQCFISENIRNNWVIKDPISLIELSNDLYLPSNRKQRFKENRSEKEYILSTYVSDCEQRGLTSYHKDALPPELNIRNNHTTAKAVMRILLACPGLLTEYYFNQALISKKVNEIFGLNTSQQSISKTFQYFVGKGWLKVTKKAIKGKRSTHYTATGLLRNLLVQTFKYKKALEKLAAPKVNLEKGEFWKENVKAYKKFYKNLKFYSKWSESMLESSRNLISNKVFKQRLRTVESTKRRILRDIQT